VPNMLAEAKRAEGCVQQRIVPRPHLRRTVEQGEQGSVTRVGQRYVHPTNERILRSCHPDMVRQAQSQFSLGLTYRPRTDPRAVLAEDLLHGYVGSAQAERFVEEPT
jgi:hypothetical protein